MLGLGSHPQCAGLLHPMKGLGEKKEKPLPSSPIPANSIIRSIEAKNKKRKKNKGKTKEKS
jgi:hypothetical protein